MPRVSKITQHTRAMKLLAGIAKHFPATGRFRIAGASYTRAQLAAVFQEQLDAMTAVGAAHALLTAAVMRERAATKRAHAAAKNLRLWAEGHFGSSALAITDFGWSIPRKTGPKTVEAKLAVARKGAATRAARKTLGKRQRQKIRGHVPPRVT
jgi:hypothetical protein